MSSDQFNAALLQRIDRLEKMLLAKDEQLRSVLADKDAQITALHVELKEWQEGLRVRGQRQRKRRRVRGAKEAPEPKPDQPNRPSGRKTGHKGTGRKKPKTIDVIEHRRLETCPDCSGELTDLGVGHHHTTEDIVLTVRTTQYQLHKHHCNACQKPHLAPLPVNLGGVPFESVPRRWHWRPGCALTCASPSATSLAFSLRALAFPGPKAPSVVGSPGSPTSSPRSPTNCGRTSSPSR